MAQVVYQLPSKPKALSSNPSTTKTKTNKQTNKKPSMKMKGSSWSKRRVGQNS
jgi:hypothetical protein